MNPAVAFWEGYRGQFVVTVDDGVVARTPTLDLPELGKRFRPRSVNLHRWPQSPGGPNAYLEVNFQGMDWEVQIHGELVSQKAAGVMRITFDGEIRALTYTGGPVDMGGDALPEDNPAEPPARLGWDDFADVREALNR